MNLLSGIICLMLCSKQLAAVTAEFQCLSRRSIVRSALKSFDVTLLQARLFRALMKLIELGSSTS